MWNFWSHWFKTKPGPARKRLVGIGPDVLARYVQAWDVLPAEQQNRLLKWTLDFVTRKNWEGCGGLALDDEMKMAVAGQVGLMVLGWQRPFYFDHVKSILVYPDIFVAPRHVPLGSGVHLQTEQTLEGQAWYGGPVIVSWADVAQPNSHKPHNLVIHEFAHQLDMLNGESADGLPPLPDWNRIRRWQQVFDQAEAQLRSACRGHLPTVLDCYGLTNRAELFAVSCEAFFEAGLFLRSEYPQVYQELAEFFQIETHLWQPQVGVDF